MEEDKDKKALEETNSSATVERGEQAIKADEAINKKDLDPSKREEEQKKDAEKWRNEG